MQIFKQNVLKKMQELKDSGITIIIVSHDLHTMKELCNKVIWIESGKIRESGDAETVISKYLNEIMNS